jgi:hypothetical protein
MQALDLAPNEESLTINLGYQSAPGRIVITATDPNTLLITSNQHGNRDKIIGGTGSPLSTCTDDDLGFQGGTTVSLRVRNGGNAKQNVQISVHGGL